MEMSGQRRPRRFSGENCRKPVFRVQQRQLVNRVPETDLCTLTVSYLLLITLQYYLQIIGGILSSSINMPKRELLYA